MTVTLFCGDCLDVMADMEPNSVDTIITDPPYGLTDPKGNTPSGTTSNTFGGYGKSLPGSRKGQRGGFMGKKWDAVVPGPPYWEAALRVAKPGAMMLAFGGTRTHHRLMCAIEDAGWEIRDCMMYLYGQGFPKSHDISKAIDKAAGAERERIPGAGRSNIGPGTHGTGTSLYGQVQTDPTRKSTIKADLTIPATPAASLWHGYGTALKPAWEPIILAMKPIEGTFANNALTHGVAGINIEGGRIGTTKRTPGYKEPQTRMNTESEWNKSSLGLRREVDTTKGRWPANLLLDEHAAAMLDEQSGESRSRPDYRDEPSSTGESGIYGTGYRRKPNLVCDTGGASRFFYCAKASRKERNAGCEGLEEHAGPKQSGGPDRRSGTARQPTEWRPPPVHNGHPCVKPIALMRYLCKLTRTPTGGVVLDPFMGSGSTGCAAVLEGRDFVGIDIGAEYVEIARRRIEHWAQVAEGEQAEMVQGEL